MAKHYRAVLLVLASDNLDIYRKFKQIYEQYLNVSNDIKVFFVLGNSTTKNTPGINDLIFDVPETYYPGMLQKTLAAITHIKNNYSCDYVIRTNLSTFWIFDRLLKRLDTLPSTNYATGPFRSCKHNGKILPSYISGTSLVMTKDAAFSLLEDESIFDIDYPEDYAMTNSLKNSSVILQPPKTRSIGIVERNTVLTQQDLEGLVSDTNIDHYRLKSSNDLRYQDILTAKFLLKHHYGKELL